MRTIIRWTGEDPERDGLIETPARVTRSFEEFFAGYGQDPVEILKKTFEEIEGYDEMIVLRGIRFESHCEHHMAPIIGQAWVAYIPNGRVVGISKLARVVDVYARRLQIQEKMTAQIANTHQRRPGTAGRRRHHQGVASLHDDARRAQAGHRPRDQPHAGLLSRQRADPSGIPGNGDIAQRGQRRSEMADQQAPPAGPDLSKGIHPVRIRRRDAARPRRRSRKFCWCVRAPRSLRSTRIAAIITGRSPRAS